MSRIYDQFVKKILNSMEEEQTVAWAVSRAGELQRMCLDEMPYNHGLAFNHMAKKWGLSYPDTPCTYIAGMNLSNQGVLAGQLQDGSFLCYFPSSITVWQNFALHKELQHKKYLILAWSLEQDEDYVSRAQLFAYASSIMERRKKKKKRKV